ncbi:hypothetical protein CEXT_163161 [Caerostris extrusa]|uniref:Uncharacterized protein n=1 Tax=Caerostris extrusa TaxID=172846 RepID=A0AAV4YAW2_CAEEX|nr:hypothetical protein CEXT_163161 [Caerostris extrusa]
MHGHKCGDSTQNRTPDTAGTVNKPLSPSLDLRFLFFYSSAFEKLLRSDKHRPHFPILAYAAYVGFTFWAQSYYGTPQFYF